MCRLHSLTDWLTVYLLLSSLRSARSQLRMTFLFHCNRMHILKFDQLCTYARVVQSPIRVVINCVTLCLRTDIITCHDE